MHFLLTILLSSLFHVQIGAPGQRACLRLPAETDSVRAVLYCHQNMTEEVLFRSAYFTAEMDRLGIAMVFVQRGSQNWDLTLLDDEGRNCQQRFEYIMSELAAHSEHPELATAPIIPFGHSAQATFPWNFAAWNPDRTLCIISYHGDAPRTNLCGYGRANVEWGRTRNIDRIPGLMVMGEYEWWEARLNPARAFRIMYPDSRISFLRDAGRGHFDLCLPTQQYLVHFIEKALLDPRPEGGVEYDGFLYQDREMMRLTRARQRETRGKQMRYVSAMVNGQLLPFDPNQHIRIRSTWTGDTLRLLPVFVDSTHTIINHQSSITNPPSAVLISGAAREVAPNTFVRDTAYFGEDPKRLWDGVTICVEADGDRRYKSAVREMNFQFATPRPDTIHLGVLEAKDWDTIRLEKGHYYEGQILIRGCRNVVVEGNGATLRPVGRGYGVEITGSRNITIRDITTTQVPTGNSDSVLIENVRCYTSYSWGDGLNIFASSHVTIRGCYCETSDDCLTVYATRMGHIGSSRHILVEDCVFNPKVAHPIFIGLHGAASYEADMRDRNLPMVANHADIVRQTDTIEDVTFRRITILNQNEPQLDYQGCMAIVAGDNNVVRNILFEDIEVKHINKGSLLSLRIFQNEKYCQAPGRSIENITFRRVSAPEQGEISLIEGYSPERMVRNVLFEGLRIGGKHICDTMPGKPRWYKTADMGRILISNYTENILFK